MGESNQVKMNVPELKSATPKVFMKFWKSFMAYAASKEFTEVLAEEKYADLPDSEVSPKQGKVKVKSESDIDPIKDKEEGKEDEAKTLKAALIKHRKGISAFTMAFENCSNDFPRICITR